MAPKERLWNISLLRMFATLIIVAFHVMIVLSPDIGKNYFPFYIGVPIFLFISGFLYANKKIDHVGHFYLNNILKILIPTAVFIGLCAAIAGIYSLATGIEYQALFAGRIGGGKEGNILGHLWYIPAIIACYFILPLLQKIHAGQLKKVFVCLSIILFVLIEIACIYICTSVVIPFVLGFIIQKQRNKIATKKHWAITLSIILFLAGGTAYPFLYSCTSNHIALQALINYVRELIVGVMGISFSTLFILLTEKIRFPRWAEKFLGWFDKLSFPIYFVHHLFLVGFLNVLATTQYLFVNILLYLIVSLVASIAFHFLITAINKIKWVKKEKINQQN